MKNWITTREEILNTQLPETTRSYSPIPHSVFLNEIAEHLDKKGYSIAEERFLTANQNQVITGNFRISNNEDNEMMPAISFVNSYNKSRKAEIRATGLVMICKNLMMGTVKGGYYKRKHSGTALQDFRGQIEGVVDSLEEEFRRLVLNKQEMKQIELDKKTKALLVGDMLINEQMINLTQLGILQDEMQFSKDFPGNSLWSFYNNVTEAYHENHPVNHDKQHLKFHSYISSKFNLTGNNKLFGDQIIETIDFSEVEEDMALTLSRN